MQFRKHICGYVFLALCVVLTVIMVPSVNAQVDDSEQGLGYSEGPFELIENPTSATGETPLQAAQAASENTSVMTQEAGFILPLENEQYAFITVIADYIGNSVVLIKSGNQDWQFVCRSGGLMEAEQLVADCGVSQAISTQLYEGLLEEIQKVLR